jgi:hypothetical protein
MKNPNNPIGNETQNLLACSAVPRQTAAPRTPMFNYNESNTVYKNCVTCEYKKLVITNILGGGGESTLLFHVYQQIFINAV